MLNIEILTEKLGLNQSELDELKNYNSNTRVLFYKLKHPNGSDIYIYGYYPPDDEVMGLVITRAWTGQLGGFDGVIHPDDLIASVPSLSFQRISLSELRGKLQYING